MKHARFLALAMGMVLSGGAFAQEGKLDMSGPLRLPGLSTVKDKVGLEPDQVPKIEAIYKEAQAKDNELRGGDRKKGAQELMSARTEFINRIKDVLDDTQDTKFDELTRKQKGGK